MVSYQRFSDVTFALWQIASIPYGFIVYILVGYEDFRDSKSFMVQPSILNSLATGEKLMATQSVGAGVKYTLKRESNHKAHCHRDALHYQASYRISK